MPSVASPLSHRRRSAIAIGVVVLAAAAMVS